jgi:hypothetical protein
MPRDPQSTEVLQFLEYRYSELDLKWQVEGVKALSEGSECLRNLQQFSCGDPVLWLRQPKPTQKVAESPRIDVGPDGSSGAETLTATNASEDSASASTSQSREVPGWTAWKPYVDSDCVETIKKDLHGMWYFRFTELYSDYEGCLKALFTDEDVKEDSEMMMLVQSLEDN